MPILILLFLKKSAMCPIAELLKINQTANIVVYQQIKPCWYVHIQKKNYIASGSIGIVITAVLWLMVTMPREQWKNTSQHLTEKQLIHWVKKTCQASQCIQQLGVFPHGIMVKFTPGFGIPRECDRLKKGGVLCSNTRLLQGY
jgi:hypothetical protein